uniref:F-box domain-containing protein n=1 Tax=Mycena chlorophos TaxID=658473 RepID=A0ABQ0M1D4_MYCCL|nr:predicted protein [Mycena chlorophos]
MPKITNVLPFSPYGYTPTEYVCIIYVVLFSLSTIIHIGQAGRYRLWWLFPTAIFAGLIEIVGWAARLWSSIAVHEVKPYEIQLVTTLCAPTPLAAANFTTLGGMITRMGPQYSRLGPKKYTAIFLCCDVFSLLVQGIGGGIGAHAVAVNKSPKTGGHVMLLGIILQLLTIVLYVLCAGEFVYRYLHDRPLSKRVEAGNTTPRGPGAPSLSPDMRLLLYGMSFNTLCLLIRAIYRVIELAFGFRGRIVETQVYFNVLDAAMITLAIWALNFTHPGRLMYRASTESGREELGRCRHTRLSSSVMADPSPRLPPELEQEIFELASTAHPETVPTLIRVARRVQEWTEPFLYRTLRVRDSTRLSAFIAALHTKPASFLARGLRHVLFESVPECTNELCLEIIAKCPHITSVGTTNTFCGPAAFDGLASLRHLRRMAVSLCEIMPWDDTADDFEWERLCVDPARASPALARITHLSLHDNMDQTHHLVLDALPCMPCLTHLRLKLRGLPADTARSMLSSRRPRLEVLLLTMGYRSDASIKTFPVDDIRLVCGLAHDSYDEFWDEWTKSSLGEDDMWTVAEELVDRRRQSQLALALEDLTLADQPPRQTKSDDPEHSEAVLAELEWISQPSRSPASAESDSDEEQGQQLDTQ